MSKNIDSQPVGFWKKIRLLDDYITVQKVDNLGIVFYQRSFESTDKAYKKYNFLRKKLSRMPL